MSIAVVRSISCLAATVVAITAFGASATTILVVDFENDATGVNVLNDFESVDSSSIHFSDTIGTNLFVIEETLGVNNALLVGGNDDSGLLIELDGFASEISLDFGYTDFNAVSGENAVLTVFNGVVEVGSSFVELALTTGITQSITYEGVLFDSAIFKYDVALGLAEIVDNIQVTTLPEPSAGLVFAIGALLFGAVCGRRSPDKFEPRATHD